MKFIEWFYSSVLILNKMGDDNEKIISNFILFWSIILLISIILCIVFSTVDGLFLYFALFAIYHRQIGLNDNDEWRKYSQKVLTNNFARLFYNLYKLMWVLFICFIMFCILKHYRFIF